MVSVARRVIAVMAGAFFDDLISLDRRNALGSGDDGLQFILGQLGAPPEPEKCIPPAPVRAYLGAVADVSNAHDQNVVRFSPKTASVSKVRELALACLRSGTCTSGEASKLRGCLGWTNTHSFGKMGRIGVRAVKERQYSHHGSTSLDALLTDALHHIIMLMSVVRPVWVPLLPETRPFRIVYSDASVEEGKDPILGWILLSSSGEVWGARTCTLPLNSMPGWKARKTQICAAETFCFPAAMLDAPAFFANHDVLWFCDNEAAVSTIIRGACRPEDISGLAEASTILSARLGARIWVEWIDSKSNPSDGLSRSGLADVDYGHLATVAVFPDWGAPALYPERAATAVL